MSLSAGQQISICKILPDVTPMMLEAQLVFLGARMTAEIETAIAEEIARWAAGSGAKFTNVHPNAKNFGAEINPEREKDDIRSNIAKLLEMPAWASGSSEFFQIERG